MSESFKEDYLQKSNINMRVIDFVLHAVAGILLVELFGMSLWFIPMQWFPDAMLLYMWPYSMITNQYLPESNFVVVLHKTYHSWLAFGICAVVETLVCCFTRTGIWPVMFVYLSWAVHLTIDMFTHEVIV
jgi:hypothetical protein